VLDAWHRGRRNDERGLRPQPTSPAVCRPGRTIRRSRPGETGKRAHGHPRTTPGLSVDRPAPGPASRPRGRTGRDGNRGRERGRRRWCVACARRCGTSPSVNRRRRGSLSSWGISQRVSSWQAWTASGVLSLTFGSTQPTLERAADVIGHCEKNSRPGGPLRCASCSARGPARTPCPVVRSAASIHWTDGPHSPLWTPVKQRFINIVAMSVK
jgi:hypothetical protein